MAYHQVIVAVLEQRLSAKRIYQDLDTDHGFEGSYWSVNRYAKRLHKLRSLISIHRSILI
ncbi:hypothetical protein [Aureliella helgolandensis]|uniref:hypothetical protein n=1 Tax=Aureliella helgolandensis TaxID=2527968 RepID=UPI00119D47AF|nr:hypothetical protein [Aureliella helgolandensis]